MSCAACNEGWILGEGGARRCECVARASASRSFEAAGIPPRYQSRTLASYNGRVSPQAGAALTLANGYVREFPSQRDQGLLLVGPCGVGKTHLVVGILMECHRQYGARVRFVELRELFAQIKASFHQSETSEAKILRPLLEADVLAIDEVGASRDTEWQRETLEKLINGRYNANLATLCTTNYANLGPGGQLARTSAPVGVNAGGDFRSRAQLVIPQVARNETLGDRIGAPMWSRLQEMCRAVEIDGEDQRTKRRAS